MSLPAKVGKSNAAIGLAQISIGNVMFVGLLGMLVLWWATRRRLMNSLGYVIFRDIYLEI